MSDLPAAVLFDMDGLLVDSEKTWYAVEIEVMAELGGDFGPDDRAAMLGHSLEEGAQYLLDLAGRSDISADEVGQRMLDGMVAHLRRGPVEWMPGLDWDQLADAHQSNADPHLRNAEAAMGSAPLSAPGDDRRAEAGPSAATASAGKPIGGFALLMLSIKGLVKSWFRQ